MSERHPGTLRHMSPTAPAASISGADLDPRVASISAVLVALTFLLMLALERLLGLTRQLAR